MDVCAAPGGKSLMIAALDKVDSLCLNDVLHRIKRIQENIQRTGISPSAILQSDGENFLLINTILTGLIVFLYFNRDDSKKS